MTYEWDWQAREEAAAHVVSGHDVDALRDLCAADLLTASFIWGWGTAGYGPRRLRRIRSRAGDRLEPALRRVLDAVSKDAVAPDPVAGYARLYGGQASQDRAAPGQEPWSRLHGFGPAFFTKFLYFGRPRSPRKRLKPAAGWRGEHQQAISPGIMSPGARVRL